MMNQRSLVFLIAASPLFAFGCRGGCNAVDKGEQGAEETVRPGDYEGDDAVQ